ncbi:MAG: hypothetical protein PHS59_14305 [Paludibacter sp.]|nr:hypothetical protein [Paludibacter sp.]
MEVFDNDRINFLKKLGLSISSTALATTGINGTTEIIMNKKEEFPLTPEQRKFMDMHEKWLDEFKEMAKIQKVKPEDKENNRKLMNLSKEAEKWQKELIEYMKDENFARYYMVVSEKVTAAI